MAEEELDAAVYPPRREENRRLQQFPPGTAQEIVDSFNAYDLDGDGVIDDIELQSALSLTENIISPSTVHFLMWRFTGNNSKKMGQKDYTSLWYSLQPLQKSFQMFDKDCNGSIDASELKSALLNSKISVSPKHLQTLVSKYDKTGQSKGIDYDDFIKCSLAVKGLASQFKEKDTNFSGSAKLTYDDFMEIVLPFIA